MCLVFINVVCPCLFQHGLQMLAGRLQASPGDLHEGSSLANNPNMLVTRQPPAPVSQSGQEISGSGLGRSSKTNPDEGSSKTNVDEGSLQLFKTRLSDSEVGLPKLAASALLCPILYIS